MDITADDSEIINQIIKLDTSEVILEDISEEELFEIGKDSLKTKRVIHEYLNDAINLLLVPRLNSNSRTGSPIHSKDFSYLELENKFYIISGIQDGYYSSRGTEAYNALLALNISGILNKVLK